MEKKGVWIVAGLAYGDEGKGSVVDYLVRKEKSCAVVRYNGGAQAGHRVVLADGREHIFAQFGSGTLVPGVRTHLSRFMIIEPIGMMREFEHLKELGFSDVFQRLTIEGDAPITTPFHIAAGRLQELHRGKTRYGSCGLGIGETVEDVRELGEDALFVKDISNTPLLRKKLFQIRERKRAKVKNWFEEIPKSEHSKHNWHVLEDTKIIEWCMERYAEFITHARVVDREFLGTLLKRGGVVFEGAQGMLLDLDYGFHPYVTQSDISYRNAFTLLREAKFEDAVRRVGVIRGYFTRHGHGPFVTENKKLAELLPDSTNTTHEWQGEFRVGYFDTVMARYALEAIGGVDQLAITNLDRLIGIPDLEICTRYEIKSEEIRFQKVKEIQGIPKLNTPNRQRQTALADILKYAKPIYQTREPIKDKKEAYSYGQELGNILRYTPSFFSFGPTADDKITFKNHI